MTIRLWSVAFLAGVMLCVTAWYLVASTKSRPVVLVGTIASNQDQALRHYTFRFEGRELRSESKGHAHSPFGVIGKDAYSLDGTLIVNGAGFVSRFEGCAPIAVVGSESKLWCIAQGVADPKRFVISELSDGQQRAPMADHTSLPAAIRVLAFDDDNIRYYYYGWWLRKFCALDRATGAQLLRSYVAQSPRWVFRSSWKTTPRETLVSDLINQSSECFGNIVPELEAMLEASGSGDDPQVIRALGQAIIELDAVDGRSKVTRFLEAIGTDDDADSRVLGLRKLVH